MPVLEYEVGFPFPAARIELALSVRHEAVMPREYAVLIDLSEPDGATVPKGLLNWGYSAPLGGYYQYVPAAQAHGLAVIQLPILTERPIGRLRLRVVPWKPIIAATDPHQIFERLLITFSAIGTETAAARARFSTVRRSDRG